MESVPRRGEGAVEGSSFGDERGGSVKDVDVVAEVAGQCSGRPVEPAGVLTHRGNDCDWLAAIGLACARDWIRLDRVVVSANGLGGAANHVLACVRLNRHVLIFGRAEVAGCINVQCLQNVAPGGSQRAAVKVDGKFLAPVQIFICAGLRNFRQLCKSWRDSHE